MFQALYNSLSGLFSFSKSLDTVSNNVANMNTLVSAAATHSLRIWLENMARGSSVPAYAPRQAICARPAMRQTLRLMVPAISSCATPAEGCITPALANSLSMIAVFWWIASAAMT